MKKHRKTPTWLEPYWRTKREATALRIITAIASLQEKSANISLTAICTEVKELTGGSVSPNSIKRNPVAYDAYLAARPLGQARSSCSTDLKGLTADLHGTGRNAMYGKIARLRRVSKDSLIAKLIAFEQQSSKHELVEQRLRDEIIRLSLSHQRTSCER